MTIGISSRGVGAGIVNNEIRKLVNLLHNIDYLYNCKILNARRRNLINWNFCTRVIKNSNYFETNKKVLDEFEKCIDEVINFEKFRTLKKENISNCIFFLEENASYWKITDMARYAVELVHEEDKNKEKEIQLEIVKDIIPDVSVIKENVFTKESKEIAKEFYETQNCRLMSILSDLLQDNDNDEIYWKHCQKEFHVKGCWVIDEILDKA